ncbi:DODA-type extradiol aromatic ring-opening family dioxygenase [Alicyclobacillus sendaiensis]|uniref:DODA-type extradiol aromatic ring-opening family dioxygenase n=1 Tax=Alicyclobacillus sendaiensis TaxID=192387 RepID=UPI000AD142B8|nr:class III extradiol ring-cleavage dioxygenase [Alicyclobacillus sendaiensis]
MTYGMPSLFIAHGSPLLAIEDSVCGRYLDGLSRHLPVPRSIVVFSAHWTEGCQTISASPQPDTLYDFYGFPEALYQIRYPAPGDPALAARIQELLVSAGIEARLDPSRGFDHGVWTILSRIFPDASIPVVSMSVDPALRPEHQFQIGQALAPLRQKGVLIIGSGATVHNLRMLRWDREDGQAEAWAEAFERWLESRITEGDLDALFAYREEAPYADWAAPRWGAEHLAPLFYAMGASHEQPKGRLLHRDWQYGSLASSIYAFGEPVR